MSFRTLLIALTAATVMTSTATAQESLSNTNVRVITSAGEFTIRLDAVRAPLTVESFLQSVDSGYYEGTIFHRVIAGFVAQAGGYTEDIELKETDISLFNESGNGLSNMRGTVGMARSNAPHSATTQFFINLADNLDLNPRPTRWGYTVFGTVVDGMDVVDTIGHSPTSSAGSLPRDVPVTPIVIQRIERIAE